MFGSRSLTRRGRAGRACVFIALALTWTHAAPSAAADEDVWAPTELTGEEGDLPEGRDVVQRAIDFMSSHDELLFEALCTYEAVQENGQKLQFDMLQRMAIRYPDRMFWVTLYDNATSDSAWCHEGTFTLLRQPANLWGRVTVPPTLSDAVSKIADEYRVTVPFVDLLSGDVSELWLGEDVEFVNYIGEAWAEGQWTDHVALRTPGADVQLWFRQGDEPFPVKMAIVRTGEDGTPGFSARFRKWASRVPKGAIPEFVPPDGSEQIEIVPVSGP